MTAPVDPPRAPNRRQVQKAQTREHLRETALRLFLAQGYDTTSVEQIATTAGVSSMTFFRHFPTKESVVDSDEYDPLIAALIRARPASEDPLTAIERALVAGIGGMASDEVAALRTRTRLIVTTPALRARLWENQFATQQLFADALAARAGSIRPTLVTRAIAAAALAAVTTALTEWSQRDDGAGADLTDTIAEAVQGVRASVRPE